MKCVRTTLLATGVAILAMSSQAWAIWDCKAYADFAIRDVNKATVAQCGFTGPRWSGDAGLHFGFCTERLSVNDDNAMTNETNIRETEVSACEQRYKCTAYGKTAIHAVKEADKLGCGFQPPRWSPDEGLHYGYCTERAAAGDQFAISNETAIRSTELEECREAKANVVISSPPPTHTVKLDVDLYDKPEEGMKIGVVPRGTLVVVSECRADNICNISGGGYAGWIYDGPDYDTLDR